MLQFTNNSALLKRTLTYGLTFLSALQIDMSCAFANEVAVSDLGASARELKSAVGSSRNSQEKASNPLLQYKGINEEFGNRLNENLNRSIKEWKQLWLTQRPNSDTYLQETLGPLQTPESQQAITDLILQLNDAKKFNCRVDGEARLPTHFKIYGIKEFCDKKEQILQKTAMHLFGLTLNLPDDLILKVNDLTVIRMIQDFVLNVKFYDEAMGPDEIFQASRNIWITATLQKALHVPVGLTSSIFGYSMLYPYSDNVFDDPNMDKTAKFKFAQKFGQMLRAEPYQIEFLHEQKVSEMVNRLYLDYPRNEFPEVQQSILSIYYGQMESMKQRDPRTTVEQILWISAFKGGTSVLADSYLAKPHLSAKEIEISFDYGFLLQMVDDLQDLSKDQNPDFNSHTVFHDPSLSKKQKGELALRLINYSKVVNDKLNALYPGNSELTQTMHNFTRLLILESIARQQDQFESEFIEQLDQRLPIKIVNLKQAEIEKNMYGLMNSVALPR